MTIPPAALTEFSRTLADPRERFAILAEGNVSLRDGDRPQDVFWVKASGVEMHRAEQGDFVSLHLPSVIEFIDGESVGDEAVSRMFEEAGAGGRRPSVEALLHAVCLSDPAVTAVAHSHPEAALSVLCSQRPELLVAGALFPDEIVVLGRHRMLVPYVDPGISLARTVRVMLDAHQQRHGASPRVIYLQNHGVFALGSSPREALQITRMVEKTARVLQGAARFGEPRYLPEDEASRIDTRPDELHRRRLLAEAREG
jgi:rhamnose utilization protein RhaD (predicted bifunctional aldolase and dehydrogenase)